MVRGPARRSAAGWRKRNRLVLVADQSSGVPVVDEGRVEVDFFEGARALIDAALAAGASVAVVVPEGGESKHGSGFLLEPRLPFIIPQGDTDLTARAALRTVGGRREAVAVTADRVLRAAFVRAGATAVPHPAFALPVANGETLSFVEIIGGREDIAGLSGLVPYYVEHNDGPVRMLGVLTGVGLRAATSLGLRVAVLSLDPIAEDPLIVQLDGGVPEQPAVLSRGGWALYALGPEDRPDTFARHGTHGHFMALTPTPSLLTAPRRADWRDAQISLAAWPGVIERIRIEDLGPLLFGCTGTAATFAGDVDRYSGVASLDAAGPVASRHTAHPDNARVVQGLLADLRAIGYCAWTHAFIHNGRTLHNVVADLPGADRSAGRRSSRSCGMFSSNGRPGRTRRRGTVSTT